MATRERGKRPTSAKVVPLKPKRAPAAKVVPLARKRTTVPRSRATQATGEMPAEAPVVEPTPASGRTTIDLTHEVAQFLYLQAEALDSKRWQEYIDLFAPDGRYWMPPGPEYTTWDGVPAIFIEDRDLMTVRMKRLMHPNAWSQQAEWGTSHIVGNVVVERIDVESGDLHVRSRFHMLELRRDEVRHFAGTYRHHLIREVDGFRIKLQRVDMVNSQAPYEYVLQAWV